jgi:hypothetical protein
MTPSLTDEEKRRRWITAWRLAGPELQSIRDNELRRRDEQSGLASLGAFESAKVESNGLASFQSWMMRLRVIELTKQLASR